MSERTAFVSAAKVASANISALCREHGISRKTGYKWLERFRSEGNAGLVDRSRRPLRSPGRVAENIEAAVCELRREHPAWGGRKIHHRLKAMEFNGPPAPSTITSILERNGLLATDRRLQRDWQRFEEEQPNELWQMDFKGHFAVGNGRCHPLTVTDDHSRFNVVLRACPDERAETVEAGLTEAFRAYGLPVRMLMDNGSPWGSERLHPHTRLTAWLIRLGIHVCHGRPYHPQTQGKEERFHRTLKEEVLNCQPNWSDLTQTQAAFDTWRAIYNGERPHEALSYQTPESRYQPSPRAMPAQLPEVVYEGGDEVRTVQRKGEISFRGRELLVSRAFIGERVALRPTGEATWDIYYCRQRVGRVDLACSASSADPAHPL